MRRGGNGGKCIMRGCGHTDLEDDGNGGEYGDDGNGGKYIIIRGGVSCVMIGNVVIGDSGL